MSKHKYIEYIVKEKTWKQIDIIINNNNNKKTNKPTESAFRSFTFICISEFIFEQEKKISEKIHRDT